MSSPKVSPRSIPRSAGGRDLIPPPLRISRPGSAPSLGTKIMSSTKEASDQRPVCESDFEDVDLGSSTSQVPTKSSGEGQRIYQVRIPARDPQPESWESTFNSVFPPGLPKISFRQIVWSRPSITVEPEAPEVEKRTENAQVSNELHYATCHKVEDESFEKAVVVDSTCSTPVSPRSSNPWKLDELPIEQVICSNLTEIVCPKPTSAIARNDKLWMVECGLGPVDSLSLSTDTESNSSSGTSGYAKAQVAHYPEPNLKPLPYPYSIPPRVYAYGRTYEPTQPNVRKAAQHPVPRYINAWSPQAVEVPSSIDTASEKRSSRNCCAWFWSRCGA